LRLSHRARDDETDVRQVHRRVRGVGVGVGAAAAAAVAAAIDTEKKVVGEEIRFILRVKTTRATRARRLVERRETRVA